MALIRTLPTRGNNVLAARFDAINEQVRALQPQPSLGLLTSRTSRGTVRTVNESVWKRARMNNGNIPRWA
jgi:hypothetical protein